MCVSEWRARKVGLLAIRNRCTESLGRSEVITTGELWKKNNNNFNYFKVESWQGVFNTHSHIHSYVGKQKSTMKKVRNK